MIYGDFLEINQKRINMGIREDETPTESEDHLQGWFSNIEILGSYSKVGVNNLTQYLIPKVGNHLET